jgi:hypothetical protein
MNGLKITILPVLYAFETLCFILGSKKISIASKIFVPDGNDSNCPSSMFNDKIPAYHHRVFYTDHPLVRGWDLETV